jgi:hypothetical protein
MSAGIVLPINNPSVRFNQLPDLIGRLSRQVNAEPSKP